MMKLQYFGHLMRRTDSLEKTLMLAKTEGRRGWQRMRWLDGINDATDMSLPFMDGETGAQRKGVTWQVRGSLPVSQPSAVPHSPSGSSGALTLCLFLLSVSLQQSFVKFPSLLQAVGSNDTSPRPRFGLRGAETALEKAGSGRKRWPAEGCGSRQRQMAG